MMRISASVNGNSLIQKLTCAVRGGATWGTLEDAGCGSGSLLVIISASAADNLDNCFIAKQRTTREASVYAAIRQGKAKTGMAEELARRIKEGAIPIISDVEGFRAYYVVYAPDDTVTAISIFNDYAGAAESNRRVLAWIEQSLTPLLAGPATAMAGPVIVHTLA